MRIAFFLLWVGLLILWKLNAGKRINILFVYSILFIRILVSTPLAQFLSWRDGASQLQLSSALPQLGPCEGGPARDPSETPLQLGPVSPCLGGRVTRRPLRAQGFSLASYSFTIDCRSKKGNWFRGLKMVWVDYKGGDMRSAWRAQPHPPFSNLAETLAFQSVPQKETRSAQRDKLPEVCARKPGPQLFSFSLPAPRHTKHPKCWKWNFHSLCWKIFQGLNFLEHFKFDTHSICQFVNWNKYMKKES